MDEVDLTIADGVAVLSLDAPRRRNALTAAMASDLLDAMATVNADPSVGATVVRGAGGHFCAGAARDELAAAAADPAAPDTYAGLGAIYDCFVRLDALRTVTIAAVRGYAVGAGVNLAMAADVRVMARDATLRSGFLGIGVHPGGGHFTLLARAAGRSAAAAMAVLGCDVDGDRAVELGLAWESLDDGAVESRCLELAAAAARDPELTRAAVTSMRAETAAGSHDLATASQLERAPQMWTLRRRAEPTS